MTRRGRKPTPKAHDHGTSALGALPRCPAHLSAAARREWRRLASPLHDAGLLTVADRGALAAYCQTYARWVEAEERLKETPALIKAPSGYPQQSPWLSIANKQLELMGRYMAELGLTPSARSRLPGTQDAGNMPTVIEFVSVYEHADGSVSPEPNQTITISDRNE